MANLEKEEDSQKKDGTFRFFKAYWAHFKNVVEWSGPTADSVPLSQLPLVIRVSEGFTKNEKIKVIVDKLVSILKNISIDIIPENEFYDNINLDFDNSKESIRIALRFNSLLLTPYYTFTDFIDFIKINTDLLVFITINHSKNRIYINDLTFTNDYIYYRNRQDIVFYDKNHNELKVRLSLPDYTPLHRCYIKVILFDNINILNIKFFYSIYLNKINKHLNEQNTFNIDTSPPNKDVAIWYTFTKIIASHLPIEFNQNQTISKFDSNWTIFSYIIKVVDFEKLISQKYPLQPVIVTDDCQKARWGGNSETNGYKLNAEVLQEGDRYYQVVIQVSSPHSNDSSPLAIFLHSTFANEIEYVKFDNGKAQLTVTAYEAFTVGAYMADDTMLELDLNRQKGYPESFYYPFVGDVLWVDDRPELYNRKIIKSLEKRGYVFYEALSTDQAIELLQNYSFDLIISDMVRGENQRAGMDLLKYLQEKQIVTPTVIYSSNYKIDDFRDEAIALGAKEVISGSRTRMTEYIEQFFSNTKA